MGAEVTRGDDWIELDMQDKRPKAVSFRTLPHPDFPTDMQAQLMAVNAIGHGFATISETILKIVLCMCLSFHAWEPIYRWKVTMPS